MHQTFGKAIEIARVRSSSALTRAARALLVAGAAVLAAPASGHDFWIEPSDLTPVAPATVRLGLRVGDTSPGQPIARRSSHLRRFDARGPGVAGDVVGVEGRDPAGVLRVQAPGFWAVGYVSSPQPHDLPAPGFERYLSEEGLDAVAALRQERGETDAPGRELFIRSAKTLLDARDWTDGGDFDLTLGLPLELVPLVDPSTVPPGGTLPVRLLSRGEPSEKTLISARPLADPPAGVAWVDARSDAAGRVELPIASAGAWLVTAVTMQPISNPDADWESVWASLTLEVGREERKAPSSAMDRP